MLDHFRKLNTPPKSVRSYPTVKDQHARFSSRGWESVKVWTLWQAWADEMFLTASDRRRLDEIEPFDEWEEFALFASHYCVVHAKTGSNAPTAMAPSLPPNPRIPFRLTVLQYGECQGQRGKRRLAAAVALSKGKDGGQPLVLNVLGLGTKSRLQSCDVFGLGDMEVEGSFNFREGGPTTRMCHSLTDLGSHGVLLAGGRGSPSSPFRDCWLLDKDLRTWRQTHDLPVPLFRHSVTALRRSGLALLVGGRGEIDAFDGCLVYHPETGWMQCEILGDRPAAVYGAALACGSSTAGGNRFSGIYAGGLEDGLISDQILLWEADISDIKVCLSFLTMQRTGSRLTRLWCNRNPLSNSPSQRCRGTRMAPPHLADC
jgi:tRNA wybutosine-synthesizing protein 4